MIANVFMQSRMKMKIEYCNTSINLLQTKSGLYPSKTKHKICHFMQQDVIQFIYTLMWKISERHLAIIVF